MTDDTFDLMKILALARLADELGSEAASADHHDQDIVDRAFEADVALLREIRRQLSVRGMLPGITVA